MLMSRRKRKGVHVRHWDASDQRPLFLARQLCFFGCTWNFSHERVPRRYCMGVHEDQMTAAVCCQRIHFRRSDDNGHRSAAAGPSPQITYLPMWSFSNGLRAWDEQYYQYLIQWAELMAPGVVARVLWFHLLFSSEGRRNDYRLAREELEKAETRARTYSYPQNADL